MTFDYELVLGMLHTNRQGLAEHLLLAQAGHLHWTSMARAIGVPLSTLRTLQGGEVYATFFFIEEQFPREQPLSSFIVDDRLAIGVTLRAFKNMAVEGTMTLDRAGSATSTSPTIRMASIFITPEKGNGQLRVAPPANGNFSGLPPLPLDENPYHLTKAAEQTGELGLFGDGWQAVSAQPFEAHYAIDPDRDTNGAGLVYFANYVAFMDAAERQAWLAAEAPLSRETLARRSLISRRIAYYGNVDVDDAVRTCVTLYRRGDDPEAIGMRYVIHRRHDDRIICRSEAVKIVPRQMA